MLAREGARVVVADLNSIAAEETKKYLDDMGMYVPTTCILCIYVLMQLQINQGDEMNTWHSQWMSQ